MKLLKDDNEVKALNYYIKITDRENEDWAHVVATRENKQELFFAGEKIWNEYNDQIKDTFLSYILDCEWNLCGCEGFAGDVIEYHEQHYINSDKTLTDKERELTSKCLQIIIDSDSKIGGFIKASNFFDEATQRNADLQEAADVSL